MEPSFEINSKMMLQEQVPRRIRPGTRYQDFYNYPNKTYDEHIEQPLGVSQWIEQAARQWALTDPKKTISPPEDASKIDLAVWKYEMVRYFCKELNWLVVKMQGYCSPKKYPQMIATEQWIYLCAAHKMPKECFAIDYMRHTLDIYTIQLNDPKKYASRQNVRENSITKLANICRRIYRLWTHAYYQHRKVYDEFEARTNLCQRFTRFCLEYKMITDLQLFIIPCEGAPECAKEADATEMKTRAEKKANLAAEKEKKLALQQAAEISAGNSGKNNDGEASSSGSKKDGKGSSGNEDKAENEPGESTVVLKD